MSNLMAATTRFRNPDTGEMLGVPEASADRKVTAGTRYAPQWQLDGYVSEAEYQAAAATRTGAKKGGVVALTPLPAPSHVPAVIPVAEAHDDELAGLLGGQVTPPRPVVESDAPILTPAQQRMAHARAARAAKGKR